MAAIIQIVVSPFGFTANDVGPIAVESDHADDYVAAVAAALEGIDFSNLSNITVSGSEGGLVVLSHDGTPLRPIIWASDTTSQADAQWCLKKQDEQWWTNEVGIVPSHLHTVTKLSWLHRSETENWQKMSFFCSPADYVRWRLVTGSLSSMVSSPQDAAQTAMWSAKDNGYSQAVLALIDHERDWSKCLPTVKATGAIVGSLFGTLVNL
jgi:xylulokinase